MTDSIESAARAEAERRWAPQPGVSTNATYGPAVVRQCSRDAFAAGAAWQAAQQSETRAALDEVARVSREAGLYDGDPFTVLDAALTQAREALAWLESVRWNRLSPQRGPLESALRALVAAVEGSKP